MEKYLEVFKDYTNKYDKNDKLISLKVSHSIRVAKLCEDIAKNMKLDEKDIKLAYIIGLTHDYGRFDQISRYHSFDDLKTMDHGEHGANLLIEMGLINEYDVDVDDYGVVAAAIRNHNKLNIEKGLNERELLMSKLIRDADKLDILYLVSKNIIDVSMEKDFSKEAVADLKKMKSVDAINVKSKSDKHLTNLGLVYDLNYEYSFKYLESSGYLEEIVYRRNDEELKKIEENIMEYVYSRGEKNGK